MRKFTDLLDSNGPRYPLHLSSFILLPQSIQPFEHANIADLSAESWSDALSTHLLSPFTLLHAFLPLVVSHQVPILFLTSTNVTSLSPPHLGLENVIAGGMEKYISTLRKELGSSQGVNCVHFRLGVFDGRSDRDALKMAVALRHENQSDDSSTASTLRRDPQRVQGSPLRELHLEVFDAIVGKRKGVVHVGRGSRTYDYLGKAMPGGLAGWMLGLQAQREQRIDEAAEARSSDPYESPGWENVEQISEEESA